MSLSIYMYILLNIRTKEGEGEGEGEGDMDVIITSACYILPIDCLYPLWLNYAHQGQPIGILLITFHFHNPFLRNTKCPEIYEINNSQMCL